VAAPPLPSNRRNSLATEDELTKAEGAAMLLSSHPRPDALRARGAGGWVARMVMDRDEVSCYFLISPSRWKVCQSIAYSALTSQEAVAASPRNAVNGAIGSD